MDRFEKGIKSSDYIEDEEKRKMAGKFEKNKPLGVTADDYRAAGGTPPKELSENPGKTLADLMGDEGLTKWFNRKRSELNEMLEDKTGNEVIKQQIKFHNQHIKNTLRYLREIGRLPKEYDDYDVDKEFKSE